MQNSKDEDNISRESSKPERQQPTTTLFSQEEIKSIVKGFIKALLSGQIVTTFRNAAEIISDAQFDGKKITLQDAQMEERFGKISFTRLINICCGVIPAKTEEIEKAINELFDWILKFRVSHRLNGNFYGWKIEERIDRLEEGLATTNRVIEEFIM